MREVLSVAGALALFLFHQAGLPCLMCPAPSSLPTSSANDSPPPAPVDWVSDRILRVLIWSLLRLPLGVRLRLMGSFVARVVAPMAGWRSRALANLNHVWPDLPEARKHAIANACANNAGRTLIENYDTDGLRTRMANAPLTGPGLDALEAARAANRPVLLLTGHYGNYEAPRAALVARGHEIGGLYRPMANRYFNAHYGDTMRRLSGPVFEQGRRGTMGLVRHLKSGGMAVLLFDLYSGKGTPIPFLGQPAPTLTSAAEIALKTNAVVIPFFGIRQPDGRSFICHFEAPLTVASPEEMMREVTARLEARIEADPGQWFWIHRRWKPERQRRRAEARIAP